MKRIKLQTTKEVITITNENLLTLYEKYSNSVFRLALSYTHSVQDAEDITQAVFMKLIEKCPHFLPDKEKAWLTKVTVNTCKDLLKSHWKQKYDALDEISENVIWDMTPNEYDVFHAVMNLPIKYRIVVHLHYYEGYSFREIANILKITTSAVSMRLHRAREILKNTLSREDFI